MEVFMLTDEEKEILDGSLLGDGNLEISETGLTARYRLTRAEKDEGYLSWGFEKFKRFVNYDKYIKYEKYDLRYDTRKFYVCFKTKRQDFFVDEFYRWYKPNYYFNRNEKIVPRDLKLTPLVCAVWFADDGSIVKKIQTW